MKVFIAHYSKLVNRKKHIVEQLNKNSITDYEFIEQFDKDEISEEDSKVYWAEPTIVTQGSQNGLFKSSYQQ